MKRLNKNQKVTQFLFNIGNVVSEKLESMTKEEREELRVKIREYIKTYNEKRGYKKTPNNRR